ncbi:MAG TPA: tRNA dimethylallyltransferase, partial [Daejeonella sp.]|nr:tRNA dimethylallyltransferase [Daejeonella sp.]
ANPRPFHIIKIGLDIARDELYERVNHRVDMMMKAGLLEEVKSLLPYRDLNALNTVGYSELFDFLEEEISLEAAIDQIKQNTRRFAKRQLTWFKRQNDIKWFEPGETEKIIEFLTQSVLQHPRREG